MKIFTKLLNVLRSPSTLPDPDTLTLALHANPSINMLAIQCTRETLKLVEKSAHPRFVRAAVAQAAKSGTTAEQYLRDQLAAIQGEITAFDAKEKEDQEHYKEKSAKVRPLLQALAKFEYGLASSRASILGRIHGVDKAREASALAASNAGLTMQEMERLGRFEPPEVSVAKWRSKIAQIDAQLAQIAAFSADPLKRMGHLAGLPIPGFEFPQKGEPVGSEA